MKKGKLQWMQNLQKVNMIHADKNAIDLGKEFSFKFNQIFA